MISYNCAAELNAIINHPDIQPGHLLGMDPPIDVTPCLARGAFGVLGEGYGFLLDPVEGGTYEVHTSILPEYRKHSKAITLAAMDELFSLTDVTNVITRIRDNKPARRLATSVGMKKLLDEDGFEFFGISRLTHILNRITQCQQQQQ